MCNYLIRFVKWHFYLHQIGIHDVPKRDSFLAFFSGLAMVITPGKLGEWLKSYLLQEMRGIPFLRTAPILLAERFTDSVALLLLAVAGFFVFRRGVGGIRRRRRRLRHRAWSSRATVRPCAPSCAPPNARR